MLLTISTTHSPATDLGYLLHKHPDRLQSIDLSAGKAHIFYPESSAERTTIAMLLDLDSIEMVRGTRNLKASGFSLQQYVNDRPYVASSFLTVAISKAFGSAMNGNCADRPALAKTAIPLEVTLSVLPAPKGGEILIRKFFEPLGYEVELTRHVLDERFPEWGDSKYFTLSLKAKVRLSELLCHLYVLIPAIDTDKHYFVGDSEIEKLLEKGEGWLKGHPEKEQIIKRYLKNLGSLSKRTLAMMDLDPVGSEEKVDEGNEVEKDRHRKRKTLHNQRLDYVVDILKENKVGSIIDLGCGEGKLLRKLIKVSQFTKISGMDVSYSELLKAQERLHWNEMSPRAKKGLDLFQGSLMYRDTRIANFDGAAIVEVIEHMDENRLSSFERVVFEYAKPRVVVITTPNQEYNVLYAFLKEKDGGEKAAMRHKDHRFEWTRDEFEKWANKVASAHGYSVSFSGVGEVHEEHGSPCQVGVFSYGN